MCSVVTLTSGPGDFRRVFADLTDSAGLDSLGFDIRAHGFMKNELSPVLFLNAEGRLSLEQKYFSLCPSWSKQWPFQFETYNARLSRPKRIRDPRSGKWLAATTPDGTAIEEYIFSVPSFRDAFNAGQTCLVPVSGAIESCYFGESAGHIVRFCPANDKFIFAIGLWNDWVDSSSGEVIPTFTLLTDAPDSFVYRHGHDRGIVTLNSSDWFEWLDGRKASGRKRLDFVRERRVQPDWRVEIERALKPGWQKKAPTQEEISAIEIWRPEARNRA
ncbi:MAG: SOS response-associated peptidase family protein [Silvanigrellaceae bacterium]